VQAKLTEAISGSGFSVAVSESVVASVVVISLADDSVGTLSFTELQPKKDIQNAESTIIAVILIFFMLTTIPFCCLLIICKKQQTAA
jgi:hypothetical protein